MKKYFMFLTYTVLSFQNKIWMRFNIGVERVASNRENNVSL